MSFFESIRDFFEVLFNSSSPEVQIKQQLKKISSELKSVNPVIYKNDLILPNFAEVIRLLYVYTKPLENLLYQTICSNDITRNTRFEDQLIITGFSPEEQKILEELSYENRKQEIKSANLKQSVIFEKQRAKFEKLKHRLNDEEFLKIDTVLADLKNLADFCRFNFFVFVQNFDHSFDPLKKSYKPNFTAQPLQAIEKTLSDFYYVLANLKINTSMLNALDALSQLRNGGIVNEDEQEDVLSNLKKINSIITTITTPEIIKKMICLSKGDPGYAPGFASYKRTARDSFVLHFQEKFSADERRIKTEIQDETIHKEIIAIFEDKQLIALEGYNLALNDLLQKNTSVSLLWITPLKIIKTFIAVYYSEKIKDLLGDINIEGFFNNPVYKNNFSSNVYACNECMDRISKFEKLFERNQKYDTAVLTGFIRDSHKDSSFMKKLLSTVNDINGAAKSLIQNIVSAFFSMYTELQDIISDSKKPNSDIITNLKVLTMSSRNHENFDLLEKQYPSWTTFFKIMKNYIIIGDVDKK